MRVLVFVVLIALAALSVLSGRWSVALVIAATKSLLVAAEYMELRVAHPAHGAVFGAFTLALTALLAVLASSP